MIVECRGTKKENGMMNSLLTFLEKVQEGQKWEYMGMVVELDVRINHDDQNALIRWEDNLEGFNDRIIVDSLESFQTHFKKFEPIVPYFKSEDKNFTLLQGDSLSLLQQFNHKFDMIFADPPYFLSNNGLSIQSGQIVSVNKGEWDKSEGLEYVNDFNRAWLTLARDKMKENATIWISGTMHNIFSVGQILKELNFKILNIITWEKTNPPPNFSCRYFTYSTEFIIWARKNEKTPHYYNYELMKTLNGGTQMKDVWKLPAIASYEKSCGKHPTQKPLSVLTRLILASTKPNAWILDPFAGSSTTGIAANLCNRKFLGIDQEAAYLEISKNRKLEILQPQKAEQIRQKIGGFIDNQQLKEFLSNEPHSQYAKNLPF